MQKIIPFSVIVVIVFSCASCNQFANKNSNESWSPKNKEVIAAMKTEDVKELIRLAINITNDSEPDLILKNNIDKWGKREECEDYLIEYLNCKDIKVINVSVNILGHIKSKRAVPALIALLLSDRELFEITTFADSKISGWTKHNVRNSIILTLKEIGDTSAVPAIEKFLSPNKYKVNPEFAAMALYTLTGKDQRYEDVYPHQQ